MHLRLRFLEMEIISDQFTRGRIRVAIFDFDGTLSLLREGWTRIMRDLMIATLRETPRREVDIALEKFVDDLIYRTAGQQTIYQMIRLAEEIEKRGGAPDTPQNYLDVFTACLLARVNERIAAITSGAQRVDAWIVPGSVAFLQALRARGIICYIASGTGENFVRAEAALLGIAPFFAGIFGAHADYKNHSKKIVIGNLVAQHGLQPGELVTFGDGAPEIADTRAVGGIAIGVASDEAARAGINPQKRAVLIQAGANVIVPDFSEQSTLLDYLFPRG